MESLIFRKDERLSRKIGLNDSFQVWKVLLVRCLENQPCIFETYYVPVDM